MDWYTKHLHFEVDTVARYQDYGLTVALLQMNEFFLELVKFDHSISKSDLALPEGHSNLHGFLKIGFSVNNIERYYESLSKDVSILAPLDDLPPIEGHQWPEKYFLLTDPDGNYVQFFSRVGKPTKSKLSPFLIGISTPDIQRSMAWYKSHLKMNRIGPIVGQPGNQRVLLERNGFIIELGQFESDRSFDELKVPEGIQRAQVHGVAKMSFLVDPIQSINNRLKNAGVTFDFELTEKPSRAGDRHLMIRDLFGTSLQFFELDK